MLNEMTVVSSETEGVKYDKEIEDLWTEVLNVIEMIQGDSENSVKFAMLQNIIEISQLFSIDKLEHLLK
jgi:hypothetical protein